MKKTLPLLLYIPFSLFAQNIEFSNVNPNSGSGYVLPGASVYSINQNIRTGEKNITITPTPGVYVTYSKPGIPQPQQPAINTKPSEEVKNISKEQETSKKIEDELWKNIKNIDNTKQPAVNQTASNPNVNITSSQNIVNKEQEKKEESRPTFIQQNDISIWNKSTINQYEQSGDNNLKQQYQNFMFNR